MFLVMLGIEINNIPEINILELNIQVSSAYNFERNNINWPLTWTFLQRINKNQV